MSGVPVLSRTKKAHISAMQDAMIIGSAVITLIRIDWLSCNVVFLSRRIMRNKIPHPKNVSRTDFSFQMTKNIPNNIALNLFSKPKSTLRFLGSDKA